MNQFRERIVIVFIVIIICGLFAYYTKDYIDDKFDDIQKLQQKSVKKMKKYIIEQNMFLLERLKQQEENEGAKASNDFGDGSGISAYNYQSVDSSDMDTIF